VIKSGYPLVVLPVASCTFWIDHFAGLVADLFRSARIIADQAIGLIAHFVSGCGHPAAASISIRVAHNFRQAL
jgi:hypothetical protein